MLQTPCIVLGDAHLGVASPDAERALLDFLRSLPSKAKSLVIMGDLFDFWFAWEHAMPRCGFRVLAAIADLRDAGVAVLWIGGNHDCWGGEALMKETGATYTLRPWIGQIGRWSTRLEHGDGLRDREDAPYRRLRRVLRHPWAIRAYGWLHPYWATRVAMASSNTSRHRGADDEGRGLLAVASTWLRQPDGPQLVVHGHSHIPSLTAVANGWYANAGAWYLDQQYFIIDDDTITRCAWHGLHADSGESHVIDVGHRVSDKTLTE